MQMSRFYSSFFIILVILYSTNSKFLNNLYHTQTEIYKEIDDLAASDCSSILKKHTIHDSGNDMIYYSLNKQTGISEKKKVVLIFGEHSRELISPEMGLYLINVFCKKEKKFDDSTVDFFLSKYEYIFVPIVNASGREIVENGDYCWRTNSRGVDINRNWASHWEASDEHNSQFPGDKPFSEWETRILLKLFKQENPEVFITTHAGTLGMYTPFAYKKFDFNTIDEEDRKKLSSMLRIIKQVNTKYCNCKAGSIGNELWYLCPGTCLDYAYEQLQVKYTFAFEIYDGLTTNQHFLKLMNDPNLKAFNYKEFMIENDKTDEVIFFQSNLRKGLKKGVLLQKYEKLSYHQENNHNESCFSQFLLKDQHNEMCMKQMNPLTEQHYNNTLILWTNVYLELLALISLNK